MSVLGWTEIVPAVLLGINAVRDFRIKKIWAGFSLSGTFCGLIIRILCDLGVLDVLAWLPFIRVRNPEENYAAFALCDGLFCLLPGLFILFMAFGSKEKIGYGDGICICMIGAWTGFWCALVSLLAAMMFILVYCMIRYFRKSELQGNQEIPFVPFLLGGYVCSYMLGLA